MNPVYTNRKFGVEVEFVGASRDAVAHALNNAGIEAAVEGYNHITRSHWKITTDASIGYHNAGELVSPILQGHRGVAELKAALDALNSVEGVGVNVNCGLHIHLDAREMTAKQILKTYQRYGKYEEAINLVLPRSRRTESRWCQSIAGNPQRRASNATTKQRLARANGKFYKVNLTNVANRGSIEFRQHSGTTEFKKISNWLSFLMQFVETSIQLADQNNRAKARSFGKVRNLIEANGMQMEHIRGSDLWNILHDDGTFMTRLSNDFLRSLYANDANRRTADFNVEMLAAEIPAYIDTALTAPVTATAARTDAGWLDGVCEDVQAYLETRRLELN